MKTEKPNNPSAFPVTATEQSYHNQSPLMPESGMTLRDYAHVKFIAAIISNADTMREITKTWNSANKSSRIEFEELVAKLGINYANAMLKVREETES